MNPMNFDFQKQPGQVRTRFYAPEAKDALVSVITPFYNAGKYFEQTFLSMMNQTFPWFEWIIVNDGSPREEDVALLYRFAAQDPRITVVTQENAGPSKARNTAVAHAKTDLIVPLDADDLIDPTYLECLYWSLKYNPDAAWSFSNSFGFQEMEYIWGPPFDAKTMKTRNLLPLTSMIRKKDYAQIGGLKVESVPYHEDWRLWLDLLSASKKPVHVTSYLFWYRRLNTGRSSGVNGSKKLSKRSDQIIAQAASTVDETVQATQFPLGTTGDPRHIPVFTPWTQATDPDHKNKRLLWIISAMDGSNEHLLAVLAAMKQHGFDSFILATDTAPHPWRQKYEDYTDELFCLPEFLDPAHYPEFISYYIQSRQIDLAVLSDSYDGGYMLPWLRQHFPDLPIADCSSLRSCCAPGDVESLHIGQDFAPDALAQTFDSLMTDDARKQERNRLSQALQSCAPLAAELYQAGMRLRLLENAPTEEAEKTGLLRKALHSLQEDGFRGFAVRAAAWLKRKKDALLRRMGQ